MSSLYELSLEFLCNLSAEQLENMCPDLSVREKMLIIKRRFDRGNWLMYNTRRFKKIKLRGIDMI